MHKIDSYGGSFQLSMIHVCHLRGLERPLMARLLLTTIAFAIDGDLEKNTDTRADWDFQISRLFWTRVFGLFTLSINCFWLFGSKIDECDWKKDLGLFGERKNHIYVVHLKIFNKTNKAKKRRFQEILDELSLRRSWCVH